MGGTVGHRHFFTYMNGVKTARDFQDDQWNEAWKKVVAYMGNPTVFRREPTTKEGWDREASFCQRKIDENKAKDSEDYFYPALTLWWETHQEVALMRATKSQSVPLPRWKESTMPTRGVRYEPYGETSPSSRPPSSLYETLTKNSPIRPMPKPTPTKRTPLATAYDGESWDTQPTTRPAPGSPTYSQLTSTEEVANQALLAENKLPTPPPSPPASPSDQSFTTKDL